MQLAGFGFPSAAAARTPPTPVRQNSGVYATAGCHRLGPGSQSQQPVAADEALLPPWPPPWSRWRRWLRQTVTSNLEDLEALNASGVEIVDAGTVDVPGGTCHAYTMTIDSEPGNATFCLDEDSGILRQMVITEAATNTTVTMTFSYEDMAVTAP